MLTLTKINPAAFKAIASLHGEIAVPAATVLRLLQGCDRSHAFKTLIGNNRGAKKQVWNISTKKR